MPLDPSIILGAGKDVTPLQNPMDVAGKALNYQNLAMQNTQARQQFGDEQALRNAYAQNTKVDENGIPSIDKQGMIKSLAATSPSSILKYQQQQATMDYETQHRQLQNQLDHYDLGARLFGGISSLPPEKQQAALDDAIQVGKKLGYDTSHISPIVDPKQTDYLASQAVGAAEQQKNKIALLEAQNAGKKLDVELFKTFGAPLSGNPGQGQGGNKGSSKASDIDPATLVSRVVPPDRQKDVFEEIKRAQLVAKNAPDILSSFDQAAKENTMIRTGGGYLRTPGSVMALHQLLLPNFKTIDGTVRQAAMDETFHNVTPQPGDTAAKIAQKRDALKNWLTSETAGTTANGFGINISKYKNTSIDPKVLAGSSGKAPARPHDKPVGSTMLGSDGQTYTKTPQGWVPSNVATK